MPTFVRVEDFSADGYCSICGGELHELKFLSDSDEEIYPQVCRKCGDGLENFLGFLTQEEKLAFLVEINEAIS
jgi:hypothetical protein